MLALGDIAAASDGGLSPLAYMLAVMRDPEEDPSRRDRLAVAAAPYLHPKAGEVGIGGKKGERAKAAEDAADGAFRAGEAPRLVVNNR